MRCQARIRDAVKLTESLADDRGIQALAKAPVMIQLAPVKQSAAKIASTYASRSTFLAITSGITKYRAQTAISGPKGGIVSDINIAKPK
jgi:hypothetical protein